MLTLHIDSDKFDRFLERKNISSRTLSKVLKVPKVPTKRTISSWFDGAEVAFRWQEAIRQHFGNSLEIFDQNGCLLSDVHALGVTREKLEFVRIYESITPSAISEWRKGGGIEPDTLFALVNFLEIRPIDLLHTETLLYLAKLTDTNYGR